MTTTTAGAVPAFTIGDRLRKARESTGLEQGAFAELLGVSRGTVSNYERGLTNPKKVVLRAWASATRVPYEWLTSGAMADNRCTLPSRSVATSSQVSGLHGPS